MKSAKARKELVGADAKVPIGWKVKVKGSDRRQGSEFESVVRERISGISVFHEIGEMELEGFDIAPT
jgi:hypothetical protein